MNEWLDDFYSDEYRSTLLSAFAPLFRRFARSLSGTEDGAVSQEFVAQLAASYVTHHVDSSRIQLQELVKDADPAQLVETLQGRFDEWSDTRPDKVAANETRRASNAIAVQQMRESGAERKVWVASGGKTCPFCSSLDGMTVELERPFFTPDDEYQPEGAEQPLTFTSSIGHPPIHQGCSCSIQPG